MAATRGGDLRIVSQKDEGSMAHTGGAVFADEHDLAVTITDLIRMAAQHGLH